MISPTWLDLNSPSIVPPLGARRSPRLDKSGLMVSCEPDLRLVRSQIGRGKNPEAKSFFNSTLIPYRVEDKGIAVVGPFIGAPYAAMLMESMIAQGTEKIIMLGWCGAVSDKLMVGDLVIPTCAYVDEGTSRDYVYFERDSANTAPDPDLSDKLYCFADKRGVVCKKVPIWTTDAIYRETPKKVAFFRDKGAFAVEMECSALFAVGQYRKIPVTALLVVSDSVASKDWDPGFRNKKFKTARKKACELAFDLAIEI